MCDMIISLYSSSSCGQPHNYSDNKYYYHALNSGTPKKWCMKHCVILLSISELSLLLLCVFRCCGHCETWYCCREANIDCTTNESWSSKQGLSRQVLICSTTWWNTRIEGSGYLYELKTYRAGERSILVVRPRKGVVMCVTSTQRYVMKCATFNWTCFNQMTKNYSASNNNT